MLDFTFLDEDIAYYNKLGINEDYAKLKANITDFAILQGGVSINGKGKYYLKPKNARISYILPNGKFESEGYSMMNVRNIGVRPVIQTASIPYLSKYDIFVKIGNYPQYVPKNSLQEKLECQFMKGKLVITGNSYTFNSKACCEYEYKGRRFIRISTEKALVNKNGLVKLSDYFSYTPGCYVWIEVKPVVFVVNHEKKFAIARDILYAGIPFKDCEYYDGDFNNSFIKKNMDDVFSKELMQGRKKNNFIEKKSSVSNLDINIENASMLIQNAKANNKRIELHIFYEGRPKIYTIK